MKHPTSRREFLRTSLGAACLAGAGPSAVADGSSPTSSPPLPIEKGVLVSMLPRQLSYIDRFKIARDSGFVALQVAATPDPHEAETIKEAAEKTGLRIDSVMNMVHWKYPLSSSDPAVVEKSLQGTRTSLHNAELWGARCILLVPAVVNERTSYRQAWVRSQRQIRKLIHSPKS